MAAVLAAALAPAAAGAATFYVNGAIGSNANPCTDPGAPCDTIMGAVGKGRTATPGQADTIFVAAGTYDDLSLNDDQDTGLTIVGAGSGTTGTVVQGVALSYSILIGRAPPDPTTATNITVRGVRVVVAAADKVGILVTASNTHVEDVVVDMQSDSSTADAVTVNTASATLDRLEETGDWNGRGVDSLSLSGASLLTVRDSILVGGSGMDAALFAFGPVVVQRSRLSRGGPIGHVVGAMSNLTLDSSVVTGGGLGVAIFAPSGSRTGVIRNSMIDALGAGVDDSASGRRAVSATASGATAVTSVTIDSSILFESQGSNESGGGSASVACSFSNLPGQVGTDTGGGEIACGPAGGNTHGGNLFVNASGGNYHLSPGSPAVEAGSPSAIQPGESATDRDGNPRVLDGNRDCVARRDQGAYELTGNARPCPPEIRVGDVRIREGTGRSKLARFRITLSHAYDVPVTVRFRTRNGTARARSDYKRKAGSLTLAPGQTVGVVGVRVLGDRRDERRERFFLRLLSTTGGTIVDASGRALIIDND